MFNRFSHILSVLVSAFLLATLALGTFPTGRASAAGTITTCNETSLNTALTGGGTVTFACNGTIAITTLKAIATDTVVDATGYNVVLDANGYSTQIFQINVGVSLTLINLTIQNGSGGDGGAITLSRGGTLIIQNSRILNNTATTGRGGAIFADVDPAPAYRIPARIQIENSLFEGNRAGLNGGAIFIDGGEAYMGSPTRVTAFLDIKNSTFRNNRTFDNTRDGNGGAIFINYHTTFNSEGSLYTNNQAVDTGGAIFASNPSLPIANDNQHNLVNNTFSGNNANTENDGGSGGAVFLGGHSNLVHNTFYNNSVNTIGFRYGSAIFWPPDNNGVLSVTSRDNIFTGNNGSTYECMKTNTYAPYGNNNLTTDGSCNGGTTANPVNNFDTTLADNGGPTLTHALLTNSNAIDTASACTYVSTGTNPLFTNGANITRDQRGAGRPFNGDGEADTVECDKGAYEYHESITQGTCGGANLDGLQTFAFANGRTVTIDVDSLDGLNCITVEQMGRAHELGNPNIRLSNNWFHIRGNINSGFNVTLTLPASNIPDLGDQVCRYSGAGTQITWDCGVSTFDGTSITRSNVSQFSDWATFEDQTPTAIKLAAFRAITGGPVWGIPLAAGLLALVGWAYLRRKH